jgi:hypothetical protein
MLSQTLHQFSNGCCGLWHAVGAKPFGFFSKSLRPFETFASFGNRFLGNEPPCSWILASSTTAAPGVPNRFSPYNSRFFGIQLGRSIGSVTAMKVQKSYPSSCARSRIAVCSIRVHDVVPHSGRYRTATIRASFAKTLF